MAKADYYTIEHGVNDWYREQMFKRGPFGAGAWQTMHCSVYDLANRTLRICVKENDEPYDFKL